MILDVERGRLIGNLGWVDRGSLWIYTIATREVTSVPVGDAGHLILRNGAHGYFSATCGAAISIRHVAEPEIELACVRISGNHADFSGDSQLWQHFDAAVRIEDEMGARFVRIDPANGKAQSVDLTWYANGMYDKPYQSLLDCMTLPDNRRLLISVQRSSDLVVIDLEENQKIRTVPLAGRRGNPRLSMRSQTDFLASDYDTMCRIDVETLQLQAQSRLQESPAGTMTFIGDYHMDDDGALLVARPFSGDVLVVNAVDFTMIGRAHIQGQPLVPHRISDGEILARDWKTGLPYAGRFMAAA